MPLFQERLEAREQLVGDECAQAFDEHVEAPYIVPPLDSYNGAPFDLHIHFLGGVEHDSCAVLKCGDGIGGFAVDLDFGFAQADGSVDEFSVLVGVLEATEQHKGMVFGSMAVKRSRLIRLQCHERCDAVVWQAVAQGEPPASCLGVQVVPARVVACERVSLMDGKADFAPVLAWGKRNGQVVEGGPDVEQIVAHQDREALRGLDLIEVEHVIPERTLLIGLHRLDHRVFAAFTEGFGEPVDICEVLVGPLELEAMRWGGHGARESTDSSLDRREAA